MFGEVRVAGKAVVLCIKAVDFNQQQLLHPAQVLVEPNLSRNPNPLEVPIH